LLFTNFPAANFDPRMWGADAEQFDVGRSEEAFTHLTFGAGRHFCLGSFIARAELQESLAAVLARLPNLRLDGEIEWKTAGSGGLWGCECLRVAFDQP
jgi:cholest-4-en-3-one 26-monooxygenase